MFAKRKKLEIRDVFNADEDETAAPKKRKLVPLGKISLPFCWYCYRGEGAESDETKNRNWIGQFYDLDYGDDLGKKDKEKDKDKESKNPEEKRKHIKSLIEKIPTDKASLFAHPVEWSLVDNVSIFLIVFSFVQILMPFSSS